MANLYDEFKNKFTNSWFSANWTEVETKQEFNEEVVVRKDLATLETELENLKNRMEDITQKQLILANLAKLYSN